MRTLLINVDSQILNYKAVMEGVPYVRKEQYKDTVVSHDGTGYLDYYWERETLVYVSMAQAITVFKNNKYDGQYYGEFLLKEQLSYSPSSYHKPNMFLHYHLELTPNSKKLKDLHAMSSIKDPIKYIQEAMK